MKTILGIWHRRGSFFRLCKKHRFKLIIGFFLVPFASFTNIMIPVVIGKVIDILIDIGTPTDDREHLFYSYLLPYSIFLLALTFITFGLKYAIRCTVLRTSFHIEHQLREKVFLTLLTLPEKAWQKWNLGELYMRIMKDAKNIRSLYGKGWITFIENLSRSLYILVFILVNKTYLILYSFIPILCLGQLTYWLTKRLSSRYRELQKKQEKLIADMMSFVTGIHVVKVHLTDRQALQHFIRVHEKFLESNMKYARIYAFLAPLPLFFLGCATLGVLSIGGHLIKTGELTIGQVVQFILFVGMIGFPIQAFGRVAVIFQKARISLDRLQQLFENGDESFSELLHNCRPRTSDDNTSLFNGPLIFDNISFHYTESAEILQGFSAVIAPGILAGLVGKSGVGKSTLIKLLFKLWPYEGQIRFGEIDLKEIPKKILYTYTSFCPQRPFLFSGTIYLNLTFGAMGDVDETTIHQILQTACFFDEVFALPQGLKTVIGERGVTLSGGQRQRLGIARALLKRPRILILDDSLSEIDSPTRKTILANIKRMLPESTIIVIGHNIDLFEKLDEIMLINRGRLIAQGKHNDLLRKIKSYQTIFAEV